MEDRKFFYPALFLLDEVKVTADPSEDGRLNQTGGRERVLLRIHEDPQQDEQRFSDANS